MSALQVTRQDRPTTPSVFYFTSYGRVIGRAGTLKELSSEMRRLEYEDPGALRFHLAKGHIATWLRSINETELADRLEGVTTILLAQRLVDEYLEKSMIFSRMRHGRMH
jgi:hypothetical protein